MSTSDSKDKGVVIYRYSFQVLESLGQKCISVCTASSSVVSLLLPFVWMCCYTLMIHVGSKQSFACKFWGLRTLPCATSLWALQSTARNVSARQAQVRATFWISCLGTDLTAKCCSRAYCACSACLQYISPQNTTYDMLRVESRWHHSPKLKAGLVRAYDKPIHRSRTIYFGNGVVTRPSCMCLIWCCYESHKCLCRQEYLEELKLLLVFATFHVISHCRT